MNGVYKYCFSNRMSTITPKIVMFSIEISEPTSNENEVKKGVNVTGKFKPASPRLNPV